MHTQTLSLLDRRIVLVKFVNTRNALNVASITDKLRTRIVENHREPYLVFANAMSELFASECGLVNYRPHVHLTKSGCGCGLISGHCSWPLVGIRPWHDFSSSTATNRANIRTGHKSHSIVATAMGSGTNRRELSGA